ncbi:hypothetical protein [Thalassococcus lentus]|uniref:Uncharacterized protein n=1 Tax=Thalassococcus lentus TaxID=1210524 RepID=A0ABT4XXE6_9RHOB|nr:hypothetical protein [Thalassococcus lentus]MDA7426607.1 hypothetical protein [Thalassococcus lentus]
MTFVKRIWAGVLSLIAALITAAAGFVPGWYAHLAISIGIAPTWVYACIVALVLVTSAVVLAFLSKAWQGIPPLQG